MVDQPISKLEKLVQEEPEKVLIRKTEKEPYLTLYEMVARGKTVAGLKGSINLKNEFVYSVFGIEKDKSMGENDDGPYVHNKIILQGETYSTDELFTLLFQKNTYLKNGKIVKESVIRQMPKKIFEKKIKSHEIQKQTLNQLINKSKKKLIEDVFGKSMVSIFNYAHEKHLQVKEKRTGTNYYFAHSTRVASNLRSVCGVQSKGEEYCKAIETVALFHDVVESLQHWRKQKRTQYSKHMRGEKSSKEASNRIIKLNQQLDHPPELQTGGIITLFRKDLDYGEKIISMVEAISNIKKENYEAYISDIFKKVQTYLNDKSLNMKEFYDMVPIVKIHDAIDNTETLEEANADVQLKRLSKNTILAEHTYGFIRSNEITEQNNPMLWQCLEKLLDESTSVSNKLVKKYNKRSKTRKREESRELRAEAIGYKKIANDFKEVQNKLGNIYDNIQTYKKVDK